MADLADSAEAFGRILTEVVNGTVSSGVRFVVTPFHGPTELAWVYPDGSTPTDVALVPITAGRETGQSPQLWLRTSFQVRLDEGRDHLAGAAVRNDPATAIEQLRSMGYSVIS